jgi:hypothetical protein
MLQYHSIIIPMLQIFICYIKRSREKEMNKAIPTSFKKYQEFISNNTSLLTSEDFLRRLFILPVITAPTLLHHTLQQLLVPNYVHRDILYSYLETMLFEMQRYQLRYKPIVTVLQEVTKDLYFPSKVQGSICDTENKERSTFFLARNRDAYANCSNITGRLVGSELPRSPYNEDFPVKSSKDEYEPVETITQENIDIEEEEEKEEKEEKEQKFCARPK